MEITIKSTTDTELTLEGYGIVFDTEDLHGESFTKSTEFLLDNVKSIPVLWEHTITGVDDILGFAKAVRRDDIGVVFELALQRSNAYVEVVHKLVQKGRLGLSTGALPQTMQREDDGKTIKRWQVCEISATTTPAEFRTLGLKELKAIEDAILESEKAKDSQETEVSEDNKVAESPVAEDNSVTFEKSIEVVEENKMENEVKENVVDESNVALKSQLDALGAKLESIMNVLDKTPAAKAGYVTSDGGTADTNIKNFGDWLMAVKRGDEKRLTQVYHSAKDLGEGSGTAGGFLVPTEYATQLLQVASMQNAVYSRVQKVPVGVESGTYPALDQYVTPVAGSGQTAYAAGVVGTALAAGATFTETEPKFTKLNWRVNKIGGYTEVENELIEDSPFAIEALLRGLFAVAIAAKNERNILRGSGIGEPLGIINAAATVGVAETASNLFDWADVTHMYSHFKGVGGQPCWLIHPSVYPELMTLANGTDSVWQSNTQQGPTSMLNGYPIIVSEHLPQLGTTGAVILADLSAYLMFERTGLSIGFSSEVGFLKDVGTFAFKTRNDGKPWLLSAITLPDPQGSYTVSPLVQLTSS